MTKKIPAEIRKIQKEVKKYKQKRYQYSQAEEIPAIYIYTEGVNTEPIYFESLKKYAEDYLNIKIHKCSTDPLTVVEKAVDDFYASVKKNKEFIEKKTGGVFKQVWCVFDRDDFKTKFNNAIHKGLSYNYEIAFSNPCFELWFYLHKHYQSSVINRHNYEQDLENIFGVKYKKKENIIQLFINKLLEEYYPYKLQSLFDNAMNLEYNIKVCHHCSTDVINECYNCDPRTKVHYLVMLIMYKYLSDDKKNIIKNKYPEITSIIETLIT
ncbi:RloB family protein [Mucispirillum schaedleri]|uniref:RloB family protein n=1 Tax=Mucispirillum schaedleri TaxID=248039 RepID=UPI001F576723|nr:RloB family protein [Mucispirillum schaedleri]